MGTPLYVAANHHYVIDGDAVNPSTTQTAVRTKAAKVAPSVRMLDAIVTLVGRQGYAATTVTDVIELSAASRRTFYQHFSDRQDCLLRAAEELTVTWVAACESAVERARQQDEPAVDAFVNQLLVLTVGNPSALRLLLTDIGGAGDPGPAQHLRLLEGLGRALGEALDGRASGGMGASSSARTEPLVAQALAGAILQISYIRAFRGVRVGSPRRRELMGLVPEVAEWARARGTAPTPELAVGGYPPPAGGRAPGTLSPHMDSKRRRALAHSERTVSRSFVVHNQRERILDAIANLSAAKGYAAVSIPALVTEANVSVQALYEHFVDKEDALLVAYQLGHRKALAIAEQAYEAHTSRRDGVPAAVATVLNFLASEPSFAHVSLIDMPAASGRLAGIANQGTAAYVELLKAEPDTGGNGPTISTEASTYAIQTLCRLYLLEHKAQEMPALLDVATHLALGPRARP